MSAIDPHAWELLLDRLAKIEQRLDGHGRKLDDIIRETKATNGRVTTGEGDLKTLRQTLADHLREHSERAREGLEARWHRRHLGMRIVGPILGGLGLLAVEAILHIHP